MVIEINTDQLFDTALNANQFLFAQLIYDRKIDTLNKLKESWGSSVEDDLEKLVSAGYLSKDGQTYLVTEEFIRNIRGEGMFEELLALFPTSVVRPDGTKDYLRVGIDRCKTRYNSIVKKSKAKHSLIMTCLKLEIDTRTAENKLGFMKRLANWLSSKEWEAWEQRIEDSVNTVKKSAYGEDLE